MRIYIVKPVLIVHSKKKTKIGFKTAYHLMQVRSIAERSKGNILQYLRPSLSYHLSSLSLVTYWERADRLALVGDVFCIFVTFPSGVILDLSFPDLCRLSYFITSIFGGRLRQVILYI